MVMKMNKDFAYYLSHFLNDYLAVERQCSTQTIRSYKSTFQQLIDYLVNIKNIKLNNINFNIITREIICDFLNYIETEKKISIRTRNQRLAAIKSFYQYCAIDEINNIDNIKKVLSIKQKKYIKPIQEYLTEEELKQVFNVVDTSTKLGRRNLFVLVLLYDTAARANELINLKIEDIRLEENLVILNGKGKKKRIVTIMDNTKEMLIKYLKEHEINNGYLFRNNKQQKQNDCFIKDIIKSITSELTINKKITPHTFRRTRATHLLNAGINIVYIQELLGHESITTTETYAKVSSQAKFKAIKKVSPELKNEDKYADWNSDNDLLSQLINL